MDDNPFVFNILPNITITGINNNHWRFNKFDRHWKFEYSVLNFIGSESNWKFVKSETRMKTTKYFPELGTDLNLKSLPEGCPS